MELRAKIDHRPTEWVLNTTTDACKKQKTQLHY